jgi:hypothetical protein
MSNDFDLNINFQSSSLQSCSLPLAMVFEVNCSMGYCSRCCCIPGVLRAAVAPMAAASGAEPPVAVAPMALHYKIDAHTECLLKKIDAHTERGLQLPFKCSNFYF